MIYILIPSKNNQKTLLSQLTILNDLLANNNKITVVISDNSNFINSEISELCINNSWKYFFNEEMITVSDNFNICLEYIKDKPGYSVFIGDDDFISLNIISTVNKMLENDISIYRPLFKKTIYWKGYESRRGVVNSDFEVRSQSPLHLQLNNIFRNKKLNKFDGPLNNRIPSLYQCIFNNELINKFNFSFGPFAPDSYSAGFFLDKKIKYLVEFSDVIIPGVAPKSSSAFTSSKMISTFDTHPHTAIFIDNNSIYTDLPYLPEFIWFISFSLGERAASSPGAIDINDIKNMKTTYEKIKGNEKRIYFIKSLINLLTIRTTPINYKNLLNLLK